MTHILGKSTKTIRILQMFNTLKRFNYYPRTFTSVNCGNNKNLHYVHRNKINYTVSRCRSISDDTTNNAEFFMTECENKESDLVYDIPIAKDIKQLLYPNSNDSLIVEIKACVTVQDVFDVINKKCDLFDVTHACQIILGLWNIQRTYCEKYIDNLNKSDFESSPEDMLFEFTDKIGSQEEFKKVLNLIDSHHSILTVKETCTCIFYLRKLNLSHKDELIIKLIAHAENKLQFAEEEWDLQTMMQYTASLKCRDSLRLVYLIRPTIPLILKFLSNCESKEDFKNVTVCMLNIHILMTQASLDAHKEKLHHLLNSGVINGDNYDVLIQVIHFYNLLHWSNSNITEISMLCRMIKPSIEKLDANFIIMLQKVFEIHLTPATILEDLRKRVTSLIEEMKDDDTLKTYLKLPDLLFCQMSYSTIQNKQILEDITTRVLKSGFSSTYFSMYKTLRLLKTSNLKLYDLFWDNILNFVKADEYDDQILQLCFKYMYFNNNLAGTYRNSNFERKLISHLLHLKDDLVGYIPWKFSRLAAFIIAYGNQFVNIEDFDAIINKTIYHSQFLSPQDIFLISKATLICSGSKYIKARISRSLTHSLAKVCHSLDENSIKMLSKKDISLNDINFLLKGYTCRHYNGPTDHFYKLMVKYDDIKEALIPRTVRDAAYNFLATQTIVPKFLNRMANFIALNKDDALGEISQKVLSVCYSSGFIPENKDFFKYAVKNIERDQDMMSGLALLDACISMCYFEILSESLVKKVFSLEFMERIDSEINTCYAKDNYPMKLRKQLMILNRSICLDNPQYEIPWFHKKYIEEMMSLSYVKRTFFHEDVLDVLTNIIEKKGAIKFPFFSAYGYNIDFLIYLDKNGTPILHNADKSKIEKRIAVLLLHKSAFQNICEKQTLNDGSDSVSIRYVKRGYTQMRIRHLELLGYTVVEIPNSFWNSMHMAEPKAKMNYLKNKIWNEQ
ncbi:uncharacterized protein LOC143913152 [Arctopsyche grandis]|uniref:uncharacterized protein LOC143913152 n=1 Tax=Arctopsyche grandis TaxID=121162 RepID=UPI00406D84FD